MERVLRDRESKRQEKAERRFRVPLELKLLNDGE